MADIVPLTGGENRVIVKHGLSGLAEVRNLGLRKSVAQRRGLRGTRWPDATEVAFRIAPGDQRFGPGWTGAGKAVQMFLTGNPFEATTIANELFALNTERQTAERAIVNEIVEAVPRNTSHR